MKLKFTLSFTLLLIKFSIFSQITSLKLDYKNQATKPKANFNEIVAATRLQFEEQSRKLRQAGVNPVKNQGYRELNAQFERWAYFWKDRVSADGTFPNAATGWHNAINNKDIQLAAPAENASTAASVWTNIGPTKTSNLNGWTYGAGIGRVNVVKRDPLKTAIMYAGTAAGGIFKTVDLGTSWVPLTDQIAGLGVSDIIVHPTNSQILLVATGDYDASHMNSIGILKSKDGGTTWTTPLAFTLNQAVRLKHLYLDPDFVTNNTIYCTATDGIYVSTNTGDTWTKQFGSTNDENFVDIIKIGANFYVSDGWGRLYKSTAINTLAAVYTPAPFGSGNKLTFAYSPNTPDILNCLFQANPAFAKFTISTNTMSALAEVNNSTPADGNGVYNSQGGYNQVIVADPADGNHLLIGEFSGKRSTNGGTSWANYLNGYYETSGNANWGTGYVHSDTHYLEFISTDSLLIGNDGGVYIGKISTGNFKECFNGLKATQSYSIAIYDPAPDNLIIGNQDNDGSSRKVGTPTEFYAAQAGDGTATAISRSNSDIRYVGGTKGSLSYRTDGFGGGYSGTSIEKPADGSFVWPLEMHQTNGTVLYGGFDDLYKMINAPQTTAASWVNLNSGVGTGTKISFINLSKHATDAAKQRIVVIGENNVIRKTEDEAIWTTITPPSGVNFNSIFWSNNSTKMYATATGYTAGSKLFYSSDAGTTWANISDNFPNILAKKIIKYEGTDTLFVASELGVYFGKVNNSGVLQSTANATTLRPAAVGWAKLSTGLPNVRTEDIEISYTGKKIFAGTFGRGVWVADIPNANPLSVKDINFSFKNTDRADRFNLKWNIIDENIAYTTLEKSYTTKNFQLVEKFTEAGKQKMEEYPVIVDNENVYFKLSYTDISGKTFSSKIIRLANNDLLPISIYPNPASSYVQINTKNIMKSVALYNATGIQVTFANPNQKSYEFDMRLLATDTYLVKIEEANGTIHTRKIVRNN